MRESGDLGILLGHAVTRVEHDQAHVRAVDRHRCTQNAVPLNRLVHPGFFAHTRRVNKNILAAFIFKVGVDRIAGGAGNVADNDALRA